MNAPNDDLAGGAAVASAAVTRIGVARRFAFIGHAPEYGVLPGTVEGGGVAIVGARSMEPRPL